MLVASWTTPCHLHFLFYTKLSMKIIHLLLLIYFNGRLMLLNLTNPISILALSPPSKQSQHSQSQ